MLSHLPCGLPSPVVYPHLWSTLTCGLPSPVAYPVVYPHLWCTLWSTLTCGLPCTLHPTPYVLSQQTAPPAPVSWTQLHPAPYDPLPLDPGPSYTLHPMTLPLDPGPSYTLGPRGSRHDKRHRRRHRLSAV